MTHSWRGNRVGKSKRVGFALTQDQLRWPRWFLLFSPCGWRHEARLPHSVLPAKCPLLKRSTARPRFFYPAEGRSGSFEPENFLLSLPLTAIGWIFAQIYSGGSVVWSVVKRSIFAILILAVSCSKGGGSSSSALALLALAPSGSSSSGAQTPSPLPDIFPSPQPAPVAPSVTPITPVTPAPAPVANCVPSANLKLADITFADANLAACVKTTGFVFAREVTTLQCRNWVKSLAGLECLSSLKQLDVGNNPISDISPIAKLTDVEELRLDFMLTNVDLALLAPLVKLKSLNVSQIASFDRLPVENFPDMERFTASFNGLTTARASRICKMKKLKYISLYANKIEDIRFLADCPDLEELDLTDNLISEASQFGVLKSLKKLTLWGNRLVNLKGISDASNLEYLVLAYNQLENIEGLRGLGKLNALELSNNRIRNLEPVGDLPNLESFSAGYNPFVNLAPLGRLKKLKHLGFVANNDVDLQTMPEIPSAKRLVLRYSNLKRIDPLVRLPNLEWLALEDNPVEDLSPLCHLTKIEWLFISGATAQDMSPIAHLQELRYFVNEFAPDLDLTPLKNLKKIEYLLLYGARITDVSPIGSLTSLVGLDLGENQVQAGVRDLANLSTTSVFLYGNNNIPCSDLNYFSANHAGSHVLPDSCKQ